MTISLVDRFWAKVDRSGDCWEWMAARNPYDGDYGLFWLSRHDTGEAKGQTARAHRVAWEITYGTIPAGLNVCHACDNPPCVRPDHLFLGSNQANTIDKVRKMRAGADFSRPSALVRTVRWPTPQAVHGPKPEGVRDRRFPGSNKSIKLADDAVRAIRTRYAAGERVGALASEYGVHRHTISSIIAGQSRRTVR